jgi:formylglycine-generating enzyme required for sulfatase activity
VLPDLAAKGFRLPSSAEWQLAARYQTNGAWTPGSHASGDTTGPCWTEDGMGVSTAFRDYLWDWTNSGMSTQPVGTKDANALGIRDMSGNIAEWCFDDFPSTGWFKVLRGGSYWSDDPKTLQLGMVAQRGPFIDWDDQGFRFAKTL